MLTNSKEQIIRDAKFSYIPLDAVIPFVEEAGRLIAVRSGMADLISSAKCKKVIIYPDENLLLYASLKHYKYPNPESISEFTFEKGDRKLMRQILGMIG